MENTFEEVLLRTGKILNQTRCEIERLRTVVSLWNRDNAEARKNVEQEKLELTRQKAIGH